MSQCRFLFVCYSHEDKKWLDDLLEAFRKHVDPQLSQAVWCDKSISPADDWREQIESALQKSQAGVLLVSESFFKSTFIRDVEYPQLKSAYRSKRLKLTWIAVEPLQRDMAFVDFADLQSLHAPDQPLSQLAEQERSRRLEQIVADLADLIGGRNPRASRNNTTRKGRVRCLAGCGAIGLLLLAMFFLQWMSPASPVDRSQLLRILHQNVWIGYEPAEFNPNFGHSVRLDSIQRELSAIRRAGFTGIVTYGSQGDLARIPEIAKANGLAVMMGVWDPLDVSELAAAYGQRDNVEAYIVGHNGLDKLYSVHDLEIAVRWLRRRTGRPVTTTQLAKAYSASTQRLNSLGDFLCPDAHHNVVYKDVAQDAAIALETVRRLAALAEQYDRPLMVKTLTYPVQSSAQAAPDPHRQSQFLEQFLAAIRDPVEGVATPAAVVVHSAFDAPWKQGSIFQPWDPFTGLFEASGQPRPAVAAWTSRVR